MWLWLVFGAVISGALAFDLGACGGRSGVLSVSQALWLSAFWIGLAMLFDALLWASHGSQVALEFLAAYVLEKGLSVDNVFVFVVLFEAWRVPERLQRRVLQWGILGAFVLRALFIATGLQLLHAFRPLLLVFGLVLLYTGAKLFLSLAQADGGQEEETVLSADHWLPRLVRRFVPYVDDWGGGAFVVKVGGRLHVTRLMLVLVTVEIMDAVFALDSIPAILALTDRALVVYTSNVFAILGLRALFFALQGLMHAFHYLKYGLAVILLFVGVKLLCAPWWHLGVAPALLFILATLAISATASLLIRPPQHPSPQHPEEYKEHVVLSV